LRPIAAAALPQRKPTGAPRAAHVPNTAIRQMLRPFWRDDIRTTPRTIINWLHGIPLSTLGAWETAPALGRNKATGLRLKLCRLKAGSLLRLGLGITKESLSFWTKPLRDHKDR